MGALVICFIDYEKRGEKEMAPVQDQVRLTSLASCAG